MKYNSNQAFNFMKIKFFMLFVTTLIVSCSSDYDVKYSCDEACDRWVKQNLETVRVMTRNDWKKVDLSLQSAVYRAFTPQQKIDFWNSKLKETLNQDWTEAERDHIKKIQQFIDRHHDFFSKKTLNDQEENELDIYFYRWMNYATDSLKWNKEAAAILLSSGYSIKKGKNVSEINGYLVNTIETATKNAEYSPIVPDCNCKLDHVLACFGGTDECKKTNCDEVSGCGWLLLQSCTGKCGF